MIPSLMEVMGLLVTSGALYLAGRSLAYGLKRRASGHRSQNAEIKKFRDAAHQVLVQAKSERVPEAASWRGFRKFYIHHRVDEAEDITSFYLRPYDGKPVPRYLPGQHLTFRLQIPGHVKPVIRCYSLSEAPVHQNQYRVSIKRLVAPPDAHHAPDGIGSNFFHKTMENGRIVDVKSPTGNFYLDLSDQRPAVLIAGGIGITPILSMIETLAVTRSTREVWMFYSVRNRREHVMRDHLKRIARQHPNFHIVICYTQPTRNCIKGRDFHYRGRVSRRLLQGLLPGPECQFYICGPLAMQDGVVQELGEWGVAKKDIRFETFGRRKGNKKPKAAVGGDKPAVDPIEVIFERSGKVASWGPEENTLLDLAEAAGVMIDSGCRGGQCGTCVTVIKEGEVEYLEKPATPPAPGTCLACVAIPKQRLVLDA